MGRTAERQGQEGEAFENARNASREETTFEGDGRNGPYARELQAF